uniref:RNase H type-1 domain-containing protein n=1 Tax=Oryza rufipogon TaxID=4529 RepID=A0A0E0N2U2_ORYRU
MAVAGKPKLYITDPAKSLSFHPSAVAIRTAKEKGMARVELETDSLMLCNALQSNSFNLSVMGGVILEIKHVIASCFYSFSINYCPRNCNKVAHELAALGCNLQDVSSWKGLVSKIKEQTRSRWCSFRQERWTIIS